MVFTQKKILSLTLIIFLQVGQNYWLFKYQAFLEKQGINYQKIWIVFKEFYSIYRDSLEYEDRFIQNKFDNIIMSYFSRKFEQKWKL